MFSWYIIFYIFLAGTAAGAFLCGIVVNAVTGLESLLKPGVRSLRADGAGFLVAAVCFPLACIFLFCDIGRPANLLYVLQNPLASLVSAGAWIMMLSTLVSMALAFLMLTNRLRQTGAWALMGMGGVLSVATLVYTGLLLSTIPSVDFWTTPALVALFIMSGLTCGVAATSVLGVALEGSWRRDSALAKVRNACAVAELAALVWLLVDRLFATASARASVLRLVQGDLSAVFVGGVVLVGLVVPFACSALRRVADARAMTLAAGGCTLLGGLALRYAIVAAAVVEAVAFGPLFA